MGVTAPANAREALDMVRAGLGYLAAADAAQLPAVTQAECLRELEQDAAALTAARAWMLAAFTAGQGPAGDGDYSAVSWLIHRTGITRGAAVGHSAWAKRVATHPRILAALAAGEVSDSAGRLICLWGDKLPLEYRDAADEQLLAAFAGGLGLADLAALFAEMYVRARGDLPDQDPGREFADREVKLATTIGGAGVLHGDLTAECAAAVAAVLDALAAPAGAEDDRTKGQRYHDALAEAMRWLVKCIVIRHTILTWVERNFGYAVARAYARPRRGRQRGRRHGDVRACQPRRSGRRAGRADRRAPSARHGGRVMTGMAAITTCTAPAANPGLLGPVRAAGGAPRTGPAGRPAGSSRTDCTVRISFAGPGTSSSSSSPSPTCRKALCTRTTGTSSGTSCATLGRP